MNGSRNSNGDKSMSYTSLDSAKKNNITNDNGFQSLLMNPSLFKKIEDKYTDDGMMTKDCNQKNYIKLSENRYIHTNIETEGDNFCSKQEKSKKKDCNTHEIDPVLNSISNFKSIFSSELSSENDRFIADLNDDFYIAYSMLCAHQSTTDKKISLYMNLRDYYDIFMFLRYSSPYNLPCNLLYKLGDNSLGNNSNSKEKSRNAKTSAMIGKMVKDALGSYYNRLLCNDANKGYQTGLKTRIEELEQTIAIYENNDKFLADAQRDFHDLLTKKIDEQWSNFIGDAVSFGLNIAQTILDSLFKYVQPDLIADLLIKYTPSLGKSGATVFVNNDINGKVQDNMKRIFSEKNYELSNGIVIAIDKKLKPYEYRIEFQDCIIEFDHEKALNEIKDKISDLGCAERS